MADTLVNDETLKVTLEDDDSFYISTAANLNRRGTQTGIRVTESQVTDLQAYITGITGEASTSLTDTANIAYLDTVNTFTENQTVSQPGTAISLVESDLSSVINNTTYHALFPPGQILNRSRGTRASPTTVADTDILGILLWKGYDGTSFDSGALIQCVVNGAVSTGVVDTDMVFQVSDSGTVAEAVRIVKDKSLKLSGQLDINGNTILNTGTLTLPTSTDTLVGKATTDTLTNKTIDANGTGNSISNIDVADLANGVDGELITWDAAGAPAVVAVGTSAHVLTSNGAGAAPTFQAAASGFADPMTTRGDIIYKNAAGTTTRLAAGTVGQHLESDGTDIAWAAAGAASQTPWTSEIDADGFDLVDGGIIKLREQAAAEADTAGAGQIWVKTATPNQLWFTDDAGTDTQLGVGSGGATDTEFGIPLVQEVPEGTIGYPDIHDLVTASAHVSGMVLPDGATASTINLKTMFPIPDDLAGTPAARIEFVIMTKGAVAGPADVRLTVSSLAVADTESFDQALTAETETTVTMPTATETQDVYSQDMTSDPVAGDTVLVQLARDPTDAADDFTDDIQIVSATLWIQRST